MKTLMLPLSLFLLATACDSPQRNRLAMASNVGNGLTQPTSTTTNPWTTGTTTGSSTVGTTTGGAAATTTRPPGYDSCDLSAKYYAAGINNMGICQSTLDETEVAVYSTVTDSVRTCLIPTYKDTIGSSTYLGQPQCYLPEKEKVSIGKMYKTRPGFTTNPLNGVMIMKEGSLTAYFTCMNAYANFSDPTYCPAGARTNASCAQMAASVMTAKCNDFKAVHSYLDVKLK